MPREIIIRIESLETSLSILLLFLSSASQYMVRLKAHTLNPSIRSVAAPPLHHHLLLSPVCTCPHTHTLPSSLLLLLLLPTRLPAIRYFVSACALLLPACLPNIFLCSFAVLSSHNPCPKLFLSFTSICVLYSGAQNVSNHHHHFYFASTRFHSRLAQLVGSSRAHISAPFAPLVCPQQGKSTVNKQPPTKLYQHHHYQLV
ncbi:hypothetical protein BDD12DRAFT_259688 [Trichophaea hybrida]|nr:hypothetical protein BDD12DRAFT_259688 [Trichophaea hybrida]